MACAVEGSNYYADGKQAEDLNGLDPRDDGRRGSFENTNFIIRLEDAAAVHETPETYSQYLYVPVHGNAEMPYKWLK